MPANTRRAHARDTGKTPLCFCRRTYEHPQRRPRRKFRAEKPADPVSGGMAGRRRRQRQRIGKSCCLFALCVSQFDDARECVCVYVRLCVCVCVYSWTAVITY